MGVKKEVSRCSALVGGSGLVIGIYKQQTEINSLKIHELRLGKEGLEGDKSDLSSKLAQEIEKFESLKKEKASEEEKKNSATISLNLLLEKWKEKKKYREESNKNLEEFSKKEHEYTTYLSKARSVAGCINVIDNKKVSSEDCLRLLR